MLADSQNRGQIIWPIAQKLFQSVMLQTRPRWTGGRGIPVGNMRHAGTRPTMPWDDSDRPPSIYYGRYDLPPTAAKTVSRNFALCALGKRRENLSEIDDPQKAVQYGVHHMAPAVVHALKPMPVSVYVLTGISRDELGAPLGGCIINLFRVDYDSGRNKVYLHIARTISDGSGTFTFNVNSTSSYRVTAESNDASVSGVSLDTLRGV